MPAPSQPEQTNKNFFMFDFVANTPRIGKTINEKELLDMQGKSKGKTMLLPLLASNCALSSNKGAKKKTGRLKNTDMVKINKQLHETNLDKFTTNEILDTVGRELSVHQGHLLKALFYDSLPDVFTEFEIALTDKDYYRLPSAIVTAIVNSSLNLVVHIPLQIAQILLTVLAWPTSLINQPLQKVRDKKSSLGTKILFGVLTVAAALITLPFQLASIASNTLGYVRQIIDGGVTLGKAVINLVLDPPNFRQSFGQFTYALKQVVVNTLKLLPVALTLTAAYFTGGLSLFATTATVGAALGASTATVGALGAALGTASGAAMLMTFSAQVFAVLFIKAVTSIKDFFSKKEKNGGDVLKTPRQDGASNDSPRAPLLTVEKPLTAELPASLQEKFFSIEKALDPTLAAVKKHLAENTWLEEIPAKEIEEPNLPLSTKTNDKLPPQTPEVPNQEKDGEGELPHL